jgi:ABC-2 type transport system permease protein
MKHLKHILQLGVKELLSLLRDPVLLFLIVYSFTFSVYTPSKSAVMDVINASVAVVDEDHSAASRQIRDALLPPLFLLPAQIPFSEINRVLDEGIYTFVIDIPPKFQHDLTKGVAPTVELITDATAMSQAGRGPSYIQKIINHEVEQYWAARTGGRIGSWFGWSRGPDSTRTCNRVGSLPSTRSSTTSRCWRFS